MVSVHLYGKLRRAARCRNAARECVILVSAWKGATISEVLASLGIGLAETSNLFLNGELSSPTRHVQGGDRLGVFPDDMAVLYKWYFARKE